MEVTDSQCNMDYKLNEIMPDNSISFHLVWKGIHYSKGELLEKLSDVEQKADDLKRSAIETMRFLLRKVWKEERNEKK